MTGRVAELAWVVAVALLLGYEAYALATSRPTLSRVVWNIERSQWGPLLPFLAGMLCGHLFWSGQ